MNKIGLIIQREYITRVKKRSFLVTTILLPIFMFIVIAGITVAIAMSDRTQKVLIYDETGNYTHRFDSNSSSYNYIYIDKSEGVSDADLLKSKDADLLVHIFPTRENEPDSSVIFKDGGVSLSVKEHFTSAMNTIWQDQQLKNAGINIQALDSIKNQSVQVRSYDVEKAQETDADMTSGIAYFMGFLIYMVIFIYGSGVMRGVMEEKTSRIAEVIISSVSPFELMMGKIIGIALVGLT
ncbi:MAG: ABC transporter permease, partial [Chitinophagaceae bacterium]